MKALKAIFSILVIVFAVAGLAGFLEYDVSQPIMFTCLGILNLIVSKEYKDKGDIKSARYFLVLAVFIFLVIITVAGRVCL